MWGRTPVNAPPSQRRLIATTLFPCLPSIFLLLQIICHMKEIPYGDARPISALSYIAIPPGNQVTRCHRIQKPPRQRVFNAQFAARNSRGRIILNDTNYDVEYKFLLLFNTYEPLS